ncbi:MAG: IS110 family transposase [Kiritimatiellae bacterium]|nr:IS110 family transposase [Kiritimatiellia bacterium]
MKTSIGIDYHKRYSVACVMNEAGTILAEERIDHAFPERFAELIGKHTPAQVAFEATMNWGWLHEILEAIAGIERIVMANPLHVRLIAAAQVKTDKADARKLATLFGRTCCPPPTSPIAPPGCEKRSYGSALVERTKVRNRIHRPGASMAGHATGLRSFSARRARLR